MIHFKKTDEETEQAWAPAVPILIIILILNINLVQIQFQANQKATTFIFLYPICVYRTNMFTIWPKYKF